MKHPGFFELAGPFPLKDVAAACDGILADDGDPDQLINDVRALDDATDGHVSFIDNPKYLSQLQQTSASACFASEKFKPKIPDATSKLISKKPYHSFAKALNLFYPQAGRPLTQAPTYSTQSNAPLIHPTAKIEEGAIIEPGAIISAEAAIGRGTTIASGAFVGYRVNIGRDCFIGACSVLTHTLIGNNVIIHAGVKSGQDGFGFAMGPEGHFKVPQIGRVIIQDQVEIGANSTIDRGALKDTIIGEGTKIDNLVQIGHNVVIGRNCIIVAQTGISGSSKLEDFVVLGGQVGIVGHVTIGAGAQIAGSSNVKDNVPAGARWGGTPAKPIKHWFREMTILHKLAEQKSSNNEQKNNS